LKPIFFIIIFFNKPFLLGKFEYSIMKTKIKIHEK